MKLKDEMRALVAWAWARADEKGYGTDNHHGLFHETSAKFNLYDTGDDGEPSAPIWLSRVVAGILQDRAEGLTVEEGG